MTLTTVNATLVCFACPDGQNKDRALSFSDGTGDECEREVGLGGEGSQGTGDVIIAVEAQEGESQIAEQGHQMMSASFA